MTSVLPRGTNQQVPNDFLVFKGEDYMSLSFLQVAKSLGPNGIPNMILKKLAPELTLVVKDIYNQPLVKNVFHKY